MDNAVFTSRQVTAITHVSQRQLAYWRKTELLFPSLRSGGGHARYTFTDLIILRTIKQLIDAGVSLQQIRRSIHSLRNYLPTLPFPLHEMTLVATGDVIIVMHDGAAFDTLSGQQWIFPVAQLVRDSKQAIKKSHPSDAQQHDLFPESSPELIKEA